LRIEKAEQSIPKSTYNYIIFHFQLSIYLMAHVTFTDQNFQTDVLKSDMPVVVDFWATWCTPCKIVGPTIEQLAEEYKGKVKVGKMDVDENQQTAGTFGVMSIPTVMVFKKGQPVKAVVGAQSKDAYKRMIDEAIAA
jgi:thioredoxin 1